MKRISLKKLLQDNFMQNRLFSDIKSGSIAIIPTDTLYGFAVDASDSEAVAAVFRIKNRNARKPLILFISQLEELERMGACINKEQKEFLLKYWPGALTAIIEKPGSKEICAHKYKTLGVRIPAHRGLQELLSAYSGKMLTTSANRSGSPSLADADMLFKEFQNEVDWLIEDDMSCDGTASTVIDLTCEPFKILRQGKIIPDIC